MGKTVRSRIWTSVLDLQSEHINFPDSVYADYNGNKPKFNENVLGSHYEDRHGTQVVVVDPVKYVGLVAQLVHEYDPRATVYGIVHDQDVQYDENGDPVYRQGKRVLDLTPTHFHLLIHFSKAVTLNVVSGLTGIIESELERGKTKGRYAFSSAMAYLIHALEPKKHQYSPDDVLNGQFNTTVKNENGLYDDYYKAHHGEWANRKATVEHKRRNLDFDKIYEDVMLGKYTREDLLGGSDDLYKLYVEHKDKLDAARGAYLERKFIQYNRGVDNGNIKIQTLFIFGHAGNGKTRLAKAIAHGLVDNSKQSSNVDGEWRVFQTGSVHPFDEYDGEEIILLDDIRTNALDASDWLHLIDPHNSGTTSARYHDAKPMPRLLIITTTTPAHEFFSYTRGLGADEPIDQFLRRIQWSANVVNVDKIDIGHRTKLDAPLSLQLGDRVTSKSDTVKDGETTTHVNYKPGKEHEYNYAFEDWATGDFDKASSTLIRFYSTYFDLINYRDNLGLISHRKDDGTVLPVLTDGGKVEIDKAKHFHSWFSKHNKSSREHD